MEQRVFYATYPVFVLRVRKSETDLTGVDAIAAHFRSRIEDHRCARFIAVFDHYAHTRSLSEGEIAEEILDAKNVVFCFGVSIPDPEILALRPRSIGIAELRDAFVVSFLETPMPLVNSAMEAWAGEILRSPGESRARRPDPRHLR